jgi:hypothetical protein
LNLHCYIIFVLGASHIAPNSPIEAKGKRKIMYSNKFILTVLVDGRPQKELANGVVRVPFGEYSLRFRNKHNRRAVVKISIDGENVGGEGYIIPANSSIDIERWASKPVKFKFVSLDSDEAIDFGKNGPNEDKVKGTIEARFYLEKESPVYWTTPPVEHHHHYHHYPKPTVYPNWNVTYSSNPSSGLSSFSDSGPCRSDSSLRSRSLKSSGAGASASFMPCGQSMNDAESLCRDRSSSGTVMDGCAVEGNYSNSQQDLRGSGTVMDGCTVEGNYSNQSFRTAWFDAETDYVSLKVFLQGFDEEEKSVTRPKVVRESVKSKKLRDLEEENRRLKEEIKRKEQDDEEAESLRLLEEENKKLKDSLLNKIAPQG